MTTFFKQKKESFFIVTAWHSKLVPLIGYSVGATYVSEIVNK